MLRKGLAAAAGVLALVAGAGVARADDIVRLGGADTPTLRLGFDGDAGTQLVHRYHRGGFYRGGFHGGYRGFYGGFRGFYSYRPHFHHHGFYRPYYTRFSIGIYSYPRYYMPYYSSYPSYSYGYYGGYYCPINGVSVVTAPAAVVPSTGAYYPPAVSPAPSATVPAPMPPPSNGTFPYDGGPSSPIPIPADESAPAQVPGRPAFPQTGETLLVSLPGTTAAAPVASPRPQPAPRQRTQFAYPAYGEDTRASSFATNRR